MELDHLVNWLFHQAPKRMLLNNACLMFRPMHKLAVTRSKELCSLRTLDNLDEGMKSQFVKMSI